MDQRTVVVAAAIVDGGRVLVAQRAQPPEAAGRWELPGGRVDAGETEVAALVRECREELGVTVTVLDRLGDDVPLPSGALLRAYWARQAPGSAAPRAVEHLAVRWCEQPALDGLDWLDADRALVPALRAWLGPVGHADHGVS